MRDLGIGLGDVPAGGCSATVGAVISALDDSASGAAPGSAGGSDAEPSLDPVLTGAVQQVRTVLVAEVGADQVGEPGELVAEAPGVATQYFTCTHHGYPGWQWAVTITRADDSSEEVTLDDIVLLPSGEAIVAPAWVPYRERIQPGDLSPGDILPTDEDDARLVPAYFDGEEAPGEDDDTRGLRLVADELGLGRTRVLSREGRELAADRWYAGDPGPDSPLAQQAHHHCRSCRRPDRFGRALCRRRRSRARPALAARRWPVADARKCQIVPTPTSRRARSRPWPIPPRRAPPGAKLPAAPTTLRARRGRRCNSTARPRFAPSPRPC